MIISDLVDAQILVELKRRLSYAEAARRLDLPPATLSRRVKKMEDRAGLLLFERNTRAVRITQAGELTTSHAERMLEEAKAADLSIEGLRDEPAGLVRVSTPIVFGQALLGSVLSEFLRRYPNCSLDLVLSDAHVDLVEDSIDVVVRIGDIGDESLLTKPLGLVYAGLYRGTRLDNATPIKTVDDLKSVPLGILHSGRGPSPQLALIPDHGPEQLLTIEPRLVCLNPWLLKQAALKSDMIVVLPNIVAAPDVDAVLLERVLPDFHVRRTPIQLAFPSRRLMRPAVRAFIDLAADVIPEALNNAKNSQTPHYGKPLSDRSKE